MPNDAIVHVRPEGMSVGGHYSTAVRAGGFVFVSGQTPRGEDRRVIGTDIEQQTEATLARLANILGSTGLTLGEVVKVTVYLADLGDFPRFDAVYKRHFPDNPPARTTLGCQLNGVLVEIDATAFGG